MAVFLSIWSFVVSEWQIIGEFGIASAFSAYLVFLSVMSPHPPLEGTWLGGALSVLSWLGSSSMFMRVRCITAARAEKYGQMLLVWLGVSFMIGEIVGGSMMYVLVGVLRVFKDAGSS